MSRLQLAWKNILGNAFRSLAIFLCAALVAGLALTATFVVRGAESGLHSNLERLGADLLVLPWGTITENIEGIRLMSAAVKGWMPRATLDKIAAVDGVDQVSPQWYLATLNDSPYSPYPQTHLVAFDPATDFTLRPWLEGGLAEGLAEGEAIAGAHIALPGGNTVTLYGARLRLVDRLAQTETSLDDTLFVSFETVERMIAWSATQGNDGLSVMPGSISAVMVRLDLGSEPREVSVRILEEVAGVVPLETPNLFQTERRQMIGILHTLLGALGGIWALAVVFMGLVFSIAVNERRFEIGVLRALGFASPWILKALLLEGATLALAGGFVGVLTTILAFAALGGQAIRLTGLPLHVPPPLELLSISVGGQSLALASVVLAAFIPAWRISRDEVAVTLRD